jgi:HEAT repeat protein
MGDPEARAALEGALGPSRESEPSVRLAAANALGRMGDPEARAAFEAALNPSVESAPSVRIRAAEALGQLGDPEARAALKDALNPSLESEPWVRRYAADALWAIVCKSGNTPNFRPDGPFAESIYSIPEWLMPSWLKSRQKVE